MNLSKTAKTLLIGFGLVWLVTVCIIAGALFNMHQRQSTTTSKPVFACGQDASDIIARPNASEMRRLQLGASINGNCAAPRH